MCVCVWWMCVCVCVCVCVKSCSAALFAVRLQLQETGSVFEPSVGGGLSDILTTIITDIYAAASQPPRISVSHHGNYQVTLTSL